MGELSDVDKRQKEIEEESGRLQTVLDEQIYLEESATKEFSAIQIDESNFRQKNEFVQENLNRVRGELLKLADETQQLQEGLTQSQEDVVQKAAQIEQIRQTILAGDDSHTRLEQQLKEATERKEQLSEDNKSFYQKNDEFASQISELEKEIFRLNNSQEKLTEAKEYQTSYIIMHLRSVPMRHIRCRNSKNALQESRRRFADSAMSMSMRLRTIRS